MKRPPAPTTFIFVDGETFVRYHAERRRIDAEWPPIPDDPDLWDVHDVMRTAAICELREQVKRAALMWYGGVYPIPI